MLELCLIRHGLAGTSFEDEAMDYERPLKKKGKEKLKDIAKGLKDMNICFDVVLTSPLLRSMETAGIINAYCGATEEVLVCDLLQPGSSYSMLSKLLNELQEYEKIAIIGHEPFLSGFACYCLSNSKSPFISLKKGGALMLEVDKVIKPGHCKLSWLMEPKHMIK